jgi:hypothetical protein
MSFPYYFNNFKLKKLYCEHTRQTLQGEHLTTRTMRILKVIFIITTLVLGLATEGSSQDWNYCGNKRRVGIEKIRNSFPFKKSATINLVSFKRENSDDFRETPKTNGQIDLNKLYENIILDDKFKDELLDILVNYNLGPDNKKIPAKSAMCYEPRNAILFLDADKKVIAYIELCFDCSQYLLRGGKMKVGEFCNEKFERLKDIFKRSGITYGLIDAPNDNY